MWKLPLFDAKISLERNIDKEESKNFIVGPWLLGIECAKFNFYDPVLRKGKTTGDVVKSNMGQSFVIPAWKLTQLLNEPEFVMARKEEDQKVAEKIEKAAIASKAERTSAVPEKPEYETTFETLLSRRGGAVSAVLSSGADQTNRAANEVIAALQLVTIQEQNL